jgi:hypothetical protein
MPEMAENQKGKRQVSERILLLDLRRMTKGERARFLVQYAIRWREAVLTGRIKGGTGGDMLRELQGLPDFVKPK